ncbi:hydantoinase B/oxoprolinase family protein [Amycolatopsis jejuensis]|uniref:hydantoinase B/oxoprolinase family protein n=1 Tax=Amycolatopsis jejuensis TaxID=330084 RepID=UPI0005275744|nr:hydantoinase B/oxoprolinase family protein [Amycolatopsis jejuensis]
MTADPVLAEVVRHGLTAAAEHLRITLRRMAFSPVIHEVNDFAAGLFDRQARLLAQARSVPAFLGTLGVAIEAVVAAVGGEEALAPGDVLVSTLAYDTGSHAPDVTFVLPGFAGERLIGYCAVKAHVTDLGVKDAAATDTTDIFQEGLILPGVHLHRAGQRQDDVYRILLANSRAPEALAGDVAAILAAARMGLDELGRMIDRHGSATFEAAVAAMFDRGEAIVRELFAQIPDGRYVAHAALDDNAVTSEPVPLTVAVEVSGSDLTVDFTDAPPMQPGPINSPYAMTVSTARVAVMSLAGGAESCNEGFFRPLRVKTTPGTIYHAVAPAPVFVAGWVATATYDAIHRALADVLPEQVPARSGGDDCATVFIGRDSATGQFWMDGMDHGVGQGASARGDQGAPVMHAMASGVLTCCPEAIEARGALQVDRYELAQDSGGVGRHRGGLGIDGAYRAKKDCALSMLWEQTRTPAWGLRGGRDGGFNGYRVHLPDGTVHSGRKLSSFPLPAGAVVEVATGGGGGWGPPRERDPAAVRADVREGYVSEGAARRDYPHAFEGGNR